MTPNKIVITSVMLYVIILVIIHIDFSSESYANNNDAAGNAMAKGLGFFYRLVWLFLIAIAFTIVNAFFFKGITYTWIKFLFFVPIVLPILIFAITILEIGRPKTVSREEQLHRLTFEIRTKEELKNGIFSFRTSGGGGHSKLRNSMKIEDDFYVYETRNPIYYERERMFYIRPEDGYETPEYNLEIPYKPQVIPFTNWESLNGININTKDTIKLEFRYKITKK